MRRPKWFDIAWSKKGLDEQRGLLRTSHGDGWLAFIAWSVGVVTGFAGGFMACCIWARSLIEVS